MDSTVCSIKPYHPDHLNFGCSRTIMDEYLIDIVVLYPQMSHRFLMRKEPAGIHVVRRFINFRLHLGFMLHLSCEGYRRPHQAQHDGLNIFSRCFFSSLLRSNKQHRLNGIGSLTLLMMQDWPSDGFVAASDGMSRT